ncbi:MAG: hypothetical protein OK438_06155 [Thaumarchaeota archaeon]|nr:hypothetical protein [Nitrososphaerota archaeon]
MNRTRTFALLLALAVGAFGVVVLWYLEGVQSGNGSLIGTMGQMMRGQFGGGTMAPMPGYVWGGLLVLVVLIAVSVGGLAYYLAVPEIRTVATRSTDGTEGPSAARAPEDWAVVIRTSKPEERKVLEVLAAHKGSYLQKFIVKESGLSRLETHRIISRLVERGVVTATPSGNTNAISLAPWIARLPAAQTT